MGSHGKSFIGFDLSAEGGRTFSAFNPREGKSTSLQFHEAEPSEIDRASQLASDAAEALGQFSSEAIAGLLEAIREEILALGDSLIEKADEETALGTDRLRGERDRTTNQIRLFADLVREGSWVDARIDLPQSDRKPVPKPDLRRMLQPIGPVAVFGASNFPLAFSVAGGDTISALAARNPVIVKAHPAHPGTSELVASAVIRALEKVQAPKGTFSMIHGFDPAVSLGLVTHPAIRAVTFTGSLRAGRALFDAAAQRPDPIPVFAEMGSVNPVFLLPGALKDGSKSTAEGLYRSVVLGVGQFCTCPGLVFGVESEGLSTFIESLQELMHAAKPGTMLNTPIAQGYEQNFQRAAAVRGVIAHRSGIAGDLTKTEGRPGVLQADAKTWMREEVLREEIFGPATLVVKCGSSAELVDCARELEGSLTATIHGQQQELGEHRELIAALSRKAGRLLFNGYPTGVEVGYAMQHGGPYPATTDSRFTSVGTAAIFRFASPVCYQNFPDAALPAELQDENPRGIWRMIDGKRSKDKVAARG